MRLHPANYPCEHAYLPKKPVSENCALHKENSAFAMEMILTRHLLVAEFVRMQMWKARK
jgi:hypothetical protein